MKRIVILVTFAYYLCASVMCSDDGTQQRIQNDASGEPKVSMLSMLSKYIELNGTFIDENMKGSLTESYGGVWLNATRKPIVLKPTAVSGLCEIEETFEAVEEIIEKIPFEVDVEVWCWPEIRCTEKETRYREERRTQNVTKTRLVLISALAHSCW